MNFDMLNGEICRGFDERHAYTEYAFRRNFGKKDVGIQRRIR